jgi:glutathione-specific gamma-glutamylcyclotransferase
MWVFTYGSLMADGWEKQFGGRRIDRAVLQGYKRSFCKNSVRNWGTAEAPGPTLCVVSDGMAKCLGVAFDFPDGRREVILAYLRKREGKSFDFPELRVALPDGSEISAVTPVADTQASTFVGHLPIQTRAAMARIATGTSGTCLDYVRQSYAELRAMGIEDAEVNQFLQAVEDPRRTSG